MLGLQRRAVVVVPRIRGLDVGITLRWQRTDHIRKHIVRQPCQAVIVGLARPHPVAGDAWVAFRASGALSRVIPCRQEGAGWAHRKVSLPLRPGSGITVQLKWGAKGNAAVARANVIDVAGVTASAVLGVDQVNNVVKRCRFTPALVPPVAAAVRKHAGEVPNSYNARSGKARAGVGVRPSVPSISG